uniref:Transmembrane protein 217B n=1 Tax=Catagonus wagneri TaxID=51154 RepID=A0A8C3YEC8_9CETA
MNDKKFSFMLGIFSLLNTIQFLIFEVNEVRSIGYEDVFSIYKVTNLKLVSWVITYKMNVCICLSIITIVLSSVLLYCIHINNYMGLLCYAVWIIGYELLSFTVVLLTHGTIKEQFKELGYLHLIFQVSRMLLHFFSLPFLIKHMYALYKDQRILNKLSHRRHSSVSSINSW